MLCMCTDQPEQQVEVRKSTLQYYMHVHVCTGKGGERGGGGVYELSPCPFQLDQSSALQAWELD